MEIVENAEKRRGTRTSCSTASVENYVEDNRKRKIESFQHSMLPHWICFVENRLVLRAGIDVVFNVPQHFGSFFFEFFLFYDGGAVNNRRMISTGKFSAHLHIG